MRALALVALLLGCTPVDDGVAGREPAIQGSADEEASCTELSVELELDADNGVLPLEANMGARISCEADGAVAVGWDFGDGQTALGASTSHTWLGTGVFEVFVSVTDAEGNIAEDRVEVTVRAPACPEVEDAEVVGTLESDELDEASGLVQGRLDPAILWTHNDSGDGPRLFALAHTGETRAIFELAGAPEGDWEDIAIGRDAEGSPVLFVGDIGANGQDRDALVVYVLSEPAMPADGGTVELADETSLRENVAGEGVFPRVQLSLPRVEDATFKRLSGEVAADREGVSPSEIALEIERLVVREHFLAAAGGPGPVISTYLLDFGHVILGAAASNLDQIPMLQRAIVLT